LTSGKYFNRGVMALDSPYIGHVVRETDDKIVVFGEKNDRYDIPKSEIQTTGRNVLIGLKLDDISKIYKVKHDDPLPTTTPVHFCSFWLLQTTRILLHMIYNNLPPLSNYSYLENSYYRTQLLRIAFCYPSF
jgi:hypothetical protein